MLRPVVVFGEINKLCGLCGCIYLPVSGVELAGAGDVHWLADVEDGAVVGLVGVVAVRPALAPAAKSAQSAAAIQMVRSECSQNHCLGIRITVSYFIPLSYLKPYYFWSSE